MKNPLKHQKTQQGNPSQERKPAPPSAVQNLTDADLEQVQGGNLPSGGIKGESLDDQFKNKIDISSF